MKQQIVPRTGVPEPQDFDVDRCIELHNRIVSACIAKNPDVPLTRGYFNYYRKVYPDTANDLDTMREQFNDEEFCAFLDGIDIPHTTSDYGRIFFTPEVSHVCQPCDMWDLGIGGSLIGDTAFVCLYHAEEWERGRGLVFDLATMSATFVTSVFDTVDDVDSTPHQAWYTQKRLWLSLEDILQEWWDRIETGKYVPLPRKESFECTGWRWQPYRSQDLTRTLYVWDEYIDAITSRMPPTAPSQNADSKTQVAALVETNHTRGFLREFLLRFRTPPDALSFIAPGLRIPSVEFLARNLSELRKRDISENGLDGLSGLNVLWNRWGLPVVLFPLSTAAGIDSTTHGLILTPDGHQAWEDSVALSLPANTADLPWTVKLPSADKWSNALFQPGLCPYGYEHSSRLEVVLWKWKELVEQGIWTIGEHGVEGGEEWLEQRADPRIVEKEGLGIEAECVLFPTDQIEIAMDIDIDS